MKKNYIANLVSILILVCIAGGQSALAQMKAAAKVNGSVIDAEKKPLDYATLTLLRGRDSVLVKSAMTDQAGNYSFENVAPGDYLVAVSMIGYKKTYSKPFALTARGPAVTVPVIQVASDTKSLKEVSIVAQKPFIERKMDKLIVNVANSSVSAGSTALEVLEKAPGITVDKDDNISMKGKQGVLIMLDGKQTYMSSADVANMLRNMQSNQIETIELITSPSARYDAAGTSGIINIKTKKSKNMGFNGTLTAGSGYGETAKYNGGTTLNYRKNKVNLYGNYNYGDNKRLSNLNLDREVNYKDTVTDFQQINSWNNNRKSNSYKAGADYFINKNHTIGVLVNGYSNSTKNNSTSYTARSNNFNQSEKINVAGRNQEKYQDIAYNLNYKGTLDSSGKELSVDLDYSKYKGTQDELRDNYYTTVNQSAKAAKFVKNYAPSQIDIRSFKIDYTHPINKSSKIEAGLKSSFVKTDNDLLLADLAGGTWVPNTEYTNHFVYDENVNAAYLNYSKEFKKFGLQFGLRAEQTHSKGNSITKNQVVDRKYLEFFPSLSVSHSINKNNQLGFSYSRRIDRPGYDDLNPFMNFLDEYTFKKGNPYLNPQFTSSFELTHTYKGSFTTSLNYSHTVDVMTTVTEQEDSTLRTFAINRNLDEQNIYGLNVYAPVPVAKWWNINNNVQLFYMGFKSQSNNGNLDEGQVAITYNMDHSFTIDKTLTAEFSTQYRSPLQYGVFKVQGMTVMNAGLRKSFMKNKMNVRLNISDIFNARTQRLSTTYQNMNLHFTEKGESRVGRITLTYKFGKNEVKGARKRSTGLEAEANRMKN